MVESQTTRENLLHAAIEVIDQDGIKALRVRDVAARAGVKEPSVYHYFGSRDRFIEAAQAQRYSRGLLELIQGFDALVRTCSSVEDFQESIRRVFSAIVTPEREKKYAEFVQMCWVVQCRDLNLSKQWPKLKRPLIRFCLELFVLLKRRVG